MVAEEGGGGREGLQGEAAVVVRGEGYTCAVPRAGAPPHPCAAHSKRRDERLVAGAAGNARLTSTS